MRYMISGTYNVTGPLRKCSAFELSALAKLGQSGYRLAFATSLWAVTGLVQGVKWDHVLPYAGELADESTNKHVDFACMGSKHYHELMFSWSQKVLDMYRTKPAPFFLYQHMQASITKNTRNINLGPIRFWFFTLFLSKMG